MLDHSFFAKINLLVANCEDVQLEAWENRNGIHPADWHVIGFSIFIVEDLDIKVAGSDVVDGQMSQRG